MVSILRGCSSVPVCRVWWLELGLGPLCPEWSLRLCSVALSASPHCRLGGWEEYLLRGVDRNRDRTRDAQHCPHLVTNLVRWEKEKPCTQVLYVVQIPAFWNYLEWLPPSNPTPSGGNQQTPEESCEFPGITFSCYLSGFQVSQKLVMLSIWVSGVTED